jgi:hypothetical protein
VPASVSEQCLIWFGWQSGRLHQPPDGRGCHRLEHRDPPVDRRVGGEGLAGCLGQLVGHLSREPDPWIGWPGGQPQRPHQSSLVQVRSHLVQPFLTLGVDPTFECLPQSRRQLSGFFISRHVGAGDDRPQVSKRDLVGNFGRRLCPVLPLSRL